jgi:hypothetical protein
MRSTDINFSHFCACHLVIRLGAGSMALCALGSTGKMQMGGGMIITTGGPKIWPSRETAKHFCMTFANVAMSKAN